MGQDSDNTESDLRHRLAALEDEVESLRSNETTSTRRMMLKGGVAALGLGALATPSSAGTNQAGSIGGENATLDLWTEDLYIVEQGSTPSTPPSGYIDIYAKTDGNFYKLESDGTESQLGGGGLSAGEDFDGQGTSDFTNLASVSTDGINNVPYVRLGDSAATIASKIDNNDVVAFERGVYSISSTISTSDIGDTLIIGNGAFVDNTQISGQRAIEILHSGAGGPEQRVYIRDLNIIGNGSDGDGIYIEGHRFPGSVLSEYTAARLYNVHVDSVGGTGICLYRTWESALVGCRATQCNEGYLFDGVHDTSVVGCHASYNSNNGLTSTANGYNSYETMVIGGSYEDNDNYNLEFVTTTNTLYNNSMVGVSMDQGDQGNVHIGSGVENIAMSSCAVESSLNGPGILVDGGTHISLSNNLIWHNYAQQIKIDNPTTSFSISSNRLQGDNGSQLAVGIQIAAADGGTISANHATMHKAHGIETLTDNVSIVGNVATDNGQDNTAYDVGGIKLGSSVVDCVVGFNRCYDTQDTPTQEYGVMQGSDYNIYVGNSLRGNATAAFNGSAGANSQKNSNVT